MMNTLQFGGIQRTLCTLALIAFVSTGCAIFNKSLEQPRVSLSNLVVQNSTVFESVFQVKLRLLNPNDIVLNIQGAECKLLINENLFAYGLSQEIVEIPAFGTGTVDMTMYSSIFDITRVILGASMNKEMSYALKGKVKLDGTGRLPSKLRFKSEGTFPLKDIQKTLPPE